MSIELQIDPKARIVIVTVIGPNSLEDYQASLREIWDNPEYHASRGVLWDMSEAVFTLSRSKVREFALFLKNNADRRARVAAYVVPANINFGIVSMFMVYSEQEGKIRKIFRDVEAAKSWLTGENYFNDMPWQDRSE